MKVSIVIPVYNEKATIAEILRRVQEVKLKAAKEIVVVDDYSTDGTRQWLKRLAHRPGLKVVFHDKNRGKGAALRTGFGQASGEIVLIQDADLEYDPGNIPSFWSPSWTAGPTLFTALGS
jgi:glycosyltransferase involved in cell wall biosynthesis